ncbi:MAG: HAD family hydrolase [Spirochaetaceae bacterium]|nr:HAD family hydrolase [Spirochaetaceae bacterium]RKX79468.1 MAG: HAD family hydrolase [Spirochaetota bacterium]RKX88927.1 MAG: HAD family hydrolase [Spirochaetota bacterium]RKX97479.1 MAG: HAD family hydrolase [Spirochaetota bacterium]
MSKLVQELKDLKAEKDFFIGFDSDGCVFDSMEIKQKECFCPAFINNFDMQGAATAARETWEFVNLYSKTRGVNRFLAAIRAVELLAERKELKARGINVPSVAGLKAWTERETKLGEASLVPEVEKNPHPDLQRALSWSEDVTAAVKKIVRNLPPYPQVPGILKAAMPKADLMVVSQTPTGDLEREWAEHGIADFVRIIAGQERGTKAEHLEFAAVGKYDKEKILMIGDAPGDLKAAQVNGVLFYPIIPGSEELSWERFRDEGLERFFAGTYAGDFQNDLLAAFDAALPEKAPWEVNKL